MIASEVKEVRLYEPEPENVKMFLKNIDKNKCNNIKVVQYQNILMRIAKWIVIQSQINSLQEVPLNSHALSSGDVVESVKIVDDALKDARYLETTQAHYCESHHQTAFAVLKSTTIVLLDVENVLFARQSLSSSCSQLKNLAK